jgi:hypothetical protein
MGRAPQHLGDALVRVLAPIPSTVLQASPGWVLLRRLVAFFGGTQLVAAQLNLLAKTTQ